MGSSMSNANSGKDSAATDSILMSTLRGRRVDLPDGAELRVAPGAGSQRVKFVFGGSGNQASLMLIGCVELEECERSFMLYRGDNGIVYGREDRGKLHILASSLREMVCRVGVSQRDMHVVRGRMQDKECRSPTKSRSRFSDAILGRKRGVSVDRAMPPRPLGSVEEARGSYAKPVANPKLPKRGSSATRSFGAGSSSVPIPLGPRERAYSSGRYNDASQSFGGRRLPDNTPRVRFGSIQVYGGSDSECEDGRARTKTGALKNPTSRPETPRLLGRYVDLDWPDDDDVEDEEDDDYAVTVTATATTTTKNYCVSGYDVHVPWPEKRDVSSRRVSSASEPNLAAEQKKSRPDNGKPRRLSIIDENGAHRAGGQYSDVSNRSRESVGRPCPPNDGYGEETAEVMF